MVQGGGVPATCEFYVYAYRVLPLLCVCCYTAVVAVAEVLLLPADVRLRVSDGQR